MVSNSFYPNAVLLGTIISGTLNTLVYKYQNQQTTDYGPFVHPYMQAFCMFLGESFCIFLYWMNIQKQEVDESKKDPNYYVMSVPAGLDLLTSSLQHFALIFIPASIYQMLRGGVIITTAIFSKIVLGKQPTIQQLNGMAFTIIGISIVGVSNFVFKSPSDNEFSFKIQMISVILIIISLFTQGACMVSEEYILKNYNIQVFLLAGGEGIWGLLYFAILMPILNFWPCHFDDGCVYKDEVGYMERTDVFLLQMFSNYKLAIAIVIGIFSITTYNIFCINVVKYFSATARTMVDTIRTVIIWFIGYMLTITTDTKWEKTDYKAILLQFAGFITLVIGNLIYKGILTPPWLKQNQKVYDPLIKETSVQ